jgi:hypothetical protein
MPTSSSSSSTRARRASPDRPRWVFSASPIWKPAVKQGLSELIGSWKIIAMSLPAMRRRAFGPIVSRSWPSNAMRSAVTLAVNGSSPITASIATDLPEPDSPTIASTSLGSTARSTPSTALKAPDRVANDTDRLRISSSGIAFNSAASSDRARRAGRRRSG